MAEGFEKAKVTFNSDYSGLKNSSIGSYQQVNSNSSENVSREKAGNNPIEDTVSFVKENVTNAEERVNKILEKFGITLEDLKAEIFDHENSDLNERLPQLSDDDAFFVLDNGMQISYLEVDDISPDKKGYTISLKPDRTRKVILPDGLYIDSSLVENVRVEKNTVTVHLTGDGYLVYDKKNQIVKRKKPVCHVSTQENPILQKIDDYIKSVFVSWEDILHPVVTSIFTSHALNGETTINHYFDSKTTTTLWENEGIKLSNLDAFCDTGMETLNSDGEKESMSLFLRDFDTPLLIQGDTFLVDGAFKISKDAISDIRFHENSYDVYFKEGLIDKPFTVYSSELCSLSASFSLSSISYVTVYNDSMVIHFKDGRSLTYNSSDGSVSSTGDWSEEQKGGIFSEFNSYTGTYGGNHHNFFPHIDELLEDEWITNFLKEKYPDADELDYYLFFDELTNHGCGYIAIANCIFEQFEGKEELFKKYFGYDMYTVDSDGVKKYNYEYLVTEFFSYYWSDYDITSIYDYLIKQEKYKNSNLSAENYSLLREYIKDDLDQFEAFRGPVPAPRTECLKKFLEEKIPAEDYQFDAETLYDYYYDSKTMTEKPPEPPIDIDKIKEELQSGKTIELASSGYDLYTVNPVTGERGDCYIEDGGGHAMTITDVTKEGDLVVSTWGNKLIVDISSATYKTIVSRDITLGTEEPNVLDEAIQWVKDEVGLP